MLLHPKIDFHITSKALLIISKIFKCEQFFNLFLHHCNSITRAIATLIAKPTVIKVIKLHFIYFCRFFMNCSNKLDGINTAASTDTDDQMQTSQPTPPPFIESNFLTPLSKNVLSWFVNSCVTIQIS